MTAAPPLVTLTHVAWAPARTGVLVSRRNFGCFPL